MIEMRSWILVSSLALLAGCAAPRAHGPAAARAAAPLSPVPLRQGTLATTYGGHEIGREQFSDDGQVVTSHLHMDGSSDATIRIDRARRHVTLEQAGAKIERDIPPGVLAMDNLHWAAYTVAAEQFAHAQQPTAVQVLLPAQGVTVPGTIQVTARPDGGRHVVLTVGPVGIEAELSAAGQVLSAAVPSQGVAAHALAATAANEAPAAKAEPPLAAGESSFAVERDHLTLRGTFRRPDGPGPFPTVLLIAGSGPTDRDGNSRLGVSASSYRLLAEALAQRGVATLRYDKRGIGASDRPADLTAVTFQDFVDDAATVLRWARRQATVGKLYVCGHSEGGLIALEVAQQLPLDGMVLLATSGRPVAVLLREQLARQLSATQLQEYDRLIAAERAGHFLAPQDPTLATLFTQSLFRFRQGWLFADPLALQRQLTLPTLVLQGDADAQVTVGDARLLATARSGVQLRILPGVTHMLKVAPAQPPHAIYTDATLPIAPALLDAMAALVRP